MPINHNLEKSLRRELDCTILTETYQTKIKVPKPAEKDFKQFCEFHFANHELEEINRNSDNIHYMLTVNKANYRQAYV